MSYRRTCLEILVLASVFIPVQAALASTDQVIWENQGMANGDPIANPRTLNDQLGWFTVSATSSSTIRGTSSYTYNAGTTGGHAGYARIDFDARTNSPSNAYTVTYTFSQPVYNLQFMVMDVDRSSSSWADAVEIFYNGTNNVVGTSFATPGSGVALDNESYMTGYEGSGTCSIDQTNCNINMNFGSTAVSSVTIRFFSSDDAPWNPSAQFIGISDFTTTVARVTLRKQWSGAVVGDDATVTLSRGGTVIDTLASDAGTANELDTDATPVITNVSETLTLAETLAAGNTGLYDGTLACTGTSDTTPSNGLTVGATDGAIVCTFTNTRQLAALAITKTNGESQVTSGASTTYTITVSNDGPANVANALVRDVATGSGCGTSSASGLCNCSVSTQCSVVSGTATCPVSSALTYANLSGTGVSIPLLNANSSVQFQVSCQVF